MARVNHKRVKQLLNEKRSKITDRQFFTSRILAGHYEDMAVAQTRRYHYNRRVRVSIIWNPKYEQVAGTDNQCICINAGHKTVTSVRGRENRYWTVTGLFAHELGHVLYTDFLAAQTYANNLDRYRWYPAAPILKTVKDRANEVALWDYAKASQDNLLMLQIVAHHILNVLEDGYIENRMLNNFPGTLGYALETRRASQMKQMPTVTELIEREETEDLPIFSSILQLMLSYAKYGVIMYGDEPKTDERVQVVFSLIPDMDRALLTHDARERFDVVNVILVRCWEYIQPYLEAMKEQQKAAAAAGSSAELSEMLKGALSKIAGATEIGEGSSTPVPDTDGEEASATEAARKQTKEDAKESSAGAAGAGDAETSPETEEPKPEGKSGEDGESDDAGAEGGSVSGNISSDGESCENRGASETEEGRIPLHHTDHVSAPEGGTTERNDDYAPAPYEGAAADIDRLLDKMAERAACEQLENERLQELNEAAQNISYGDIHSGVSIIVNRMASVDESYIEQYKNIAPQLLTISRQLQRSLVRQLQDSRRGGKQTGLLFGRRLDSHALHRNDGKVFYKNALPQEVPQLAVALLLDESGSMCSCDRCTYARASAIILYDFCHSLDIPVMVYGHSTEGASVALYSYAEFDNIDNDDRYRMMDVSARGNNRDGAALRFVAEQLCKRSEDVKLLILVSDGQPADYGYHGTAAEEDLRGIRKEYQRKGILFVAAAIGDDKPSIERIYGDSFLDITDLAQLPSKLTAVVKRHIHL